MQNRRNTPNLKPCFMFGGMVLLCIAIGAAVSYNRFSQPGAKADFQESDINPRFKGVKPNHTDNIVNLFPDTFDYPENDYGLDLEKPLKEIQHRQALHIQLITIRHQMRAERNNMRRLAQLVRATIHN